MFGVLVWPQVPHASILPLELSLLFFSENAINIIPNEQMNS